MPAAATAQLWHRGGLRRNGVTRQRWQNGRPQSPHRRSAISKLWLVQRSTEAKVVPPPFDASSFGTFRGHVSGFRRPVTTSGADRLSAVRSAVPNVLAGRYASDEMVGIWAAEHKVVLERRLWVAVLRAQRAQGLDVPDGVIEAYEAVVDQVDLDSIAARERVTRHDVKARIEEFSALAGHELIHAGMTSRDLTENVEQLQVRVGAGPGARPDGRGAGPAGPARPPSTPTLVMAGRSHNVPAQATTAGQALRQRRRGAARRARPASTTSSPATRCAASRARSARSRTCSTCSARPTPPLAARAGRRRRPRLRRRARQRRAGVPAVARPRRRVGAGAGRVRPGQPGHDAPPHGRTGARHRGLPGRARSARRPCRTR